MPGPFFFESSSRGFAIEKNDLSRHIVTCVRSVDVRWRQHYVKDDSSPSVTHSLSTQPLAESEYVLGMGLAQSPLGGSGAPLSLTPKTLGVLV